VDAVYAMLATVSASMYRLVGIAGSMLFVFAWSASPASARSYRAGDVERALVQEFKGGHGGTDASAKCTLRSSDRRWRCRIRRDSGRSNAFRVTISSKGAWRATKFSFAGFSGRYELAGCCLRRR
jgi:hypothetical protein